MSFHEDRKFGDDGVRRFVDRYTYLVFTDGRKSDLRIEGTEIHVEHKADSYDFYDYGNLIIERYSREEKPGGPYSAEEKCKYFVYNFVANDIIYVFETKKLVKLVDKLVKKHNLKLCNRWNPKYVTRYYKIPYKYLAEIEIGMKALEAEYLKAKNKRVPK